VYKDIEKKKAQRRKYYQAHKDQIRERQKEYRKEFYQRHKEVEKKAHAKWVNKNKERWKEWTTNFHLEKNYSITLKEYSELLDKQEGVCAICGSRPGKRKLAVDHVHTSGIVRGLLCMKCNIGLGNFKEDINLLRKAIAYLRKEKENDSGNSQRV
jgi:hypothetical protein